MSKILVTAASGSAGRNIVKALLAKGIEVVATSRNIAKLSLPEGVETRTFDADARTDYDGLLKDIDRVVLVGPPLDGNTDKKLAPLIDALAEKKVDHLVYLSGNYLSGLTGRTLENLPVRRSEQQIIASGLKHTIVRAAFFMDNYLTGFYAPMVEQGRIALATGDGKSSLVSGADVGEFIAEAFIQSLTGEWIVTGPEALDHYEVAALLSRKTGKTITYVPLSEEQLLERYASRNLPSESVNYGLTLYRSYRNHATAAVTDAFRQATGRDPVSFKDFLGL